MTTTKEQKSSLQEAIADLAKDLQQDVQEIEAKPETTKGHYGFYLGLLSQWKNKEVRKVVALALIQAGANEEGVRSALELAGG